MTIHTYSGLIVQPGDFAAVRMHGEVGRLIRVGEILNGDGFRDYEHAITYVGGPDDLILEAEPSGAKIVPIHYAKGDLLWSTQNPTLNLTEEQIAHVPDVCAKLKGTPYSFLDYIALAAHRLHIPAIALEPPEKKDVLPKVVTLKTYIASTAHEICSAMVDLVRLLLRFHLFSDDRWLGYVTPADLANLIEGGPRG